MIHEQARDSHETDTDSIFGRIGPLTVRLARNIAEISRAQGLRYSIFKAEFGVPDTHAVGADIDEYDKYCDHLLVFDESDSQHKLVGTYRLLNQHRAGQAGGFYSTREFNVDDLTSRHPSLNFLELGRSCVRPAYRGRRSIELLWHGIWQYVRRHQIDVLFGCASLPGTDLAQHRTALAFLRQHALARGTWAVTPAPDVGVAMDGTISQAEASQAAIRLPPLIKGYLRLGAMIADGAVIDHAFGTTDVCMILPVSQINPRYLSHYGADASRFAPAAFG